MLRLTFISWLILLSSCMTNLKSNTVLLDYEEFGPPVVANEILGMDWWQWQEFGDSRPRKYDIKVVVYKNISLDQVKEWYPIEPDKEKDFRYLEYGKALNYLDKLIKDNVIEELTVTLVKTKNTLIDKLDGQ